MIGRHCRILKPGSKNSRAILDMIESSVERAIQANNVNNEDNSGDTRNVVVCSGTWLAVFTTAHRLVRQPS